jgi:xanthine dehydrogenase accessory factor
MLEIWKAAVEEFQQGNDFAMATILGVRGSSPRHIGTRFLVRRNGSIVGTIGGGLFEAQVQQFAWEALKEGTSHRALFSFQGKDATSLDMICGGDAEVLVEFVPSTDKVRENIFQRLMEIVRERTNAYFFTHLDIPVGSTGDSVKHLLLDDRGMRYGGFSIDEAAIRAMPQQRLLRPAQMLEIPGTNNHVFLEWIHPMGTVFIFGAGHVGACVAHLAAYVDFKVVVLDDREEFACKKQVPDADEIIVLESFEKAFEKLNVNEDSYLVIVTRGHAHDKTVLTQALRTRAGYIGMIGSRRKTKLIFESILGQGFKKEDLLRVNAPIGLPIGGETPEEIAVSIIGEMVQVRHNKDRITQLGG